jgi:hypothetical protein
MKSIKFLLLVAAVWCGANSAFAQTWTQTSAPNYQWTSIASSADGSKLVVAGQPYWIYTSTNSGATWISNNISVSNNIPNNLYDWNAVASSADGTKLVAVGGYSVIHNGQPDIHAVIFTSTNGGGIWTSNSSAPNQAWTSVASSADGNKLVIAGGVATYGQINFFTAIYTSTNAGTTWTQHYCPGIERGDYQKV